MPRIPDEEIDRLKREIDLAALVRSRGIELRVHGANFLASALSMTITSPRSGSRRRRASGTALARAARAAQ